MQLQQQQCHEGGQGAAQRVALRVCTCVYMCALVCLYVYVFVCVWCSSSSVMRVDREPPKEWPCE